MALVCKYSTVRTLFNFTFYGCRNRPLVNHLSKACFKSKVKSPSGPFRTGNFTIIATSVGAGALLGAGYSLATHKDPEGVPEINNTVELEHLILEEKPNVPIARKFINPSDGSNLKLTLFQYPTCPFCCKVRAFLDYYGISYNVVEVDPVLRQQTKWTKYRKVPILLVKVDGGYLQLIDSTMIISALTSYLHNKDPSLKETMKYYPLVEYNDAEGKHRTDSMNRYYLMYKDSIPKGKKDEEILEEMKWREWADDVLVHMLSPNVYRTTDEALQAFKWFSEVGEWERLFPSWEKNLIVYIGAYAMWGIGKKLKKKYRLKDDVRASLYDECSKWMRVVKSKGSTYFGGNQPNLADLAVYGVLCSIEGCDAFQDVLKNTGIGPWYFSMKDAVQNHRGNLELL